MFFWAAAGTGTVSTAAMTKPVNNASIFFIFFIFLIFSDGYSSVFL
jgi:hypothetical protein